MAFVKLQQQWQVVQGSGWAFALNFWFDMAMTQADARIAACSVEVTLLRPGRPVSEAIVFLSTDPSPWVTVSGGSVVGMVPIDATAAWAVGIYDVKVRVIDPALDVDRYVLTGAGKLTVQADVS